MTVVIIYFCRGTSWLSRLITWATGQGPSHAALAWRDPNLGWVTLSAEWNGWILRSVKTVGNVSAAYTLPQYDVMAGIRGNIALLGTPYDVVGAFLGQAITSMAWAWLHLRWRNLFKGRGVYCSQITARCLTSAGVPLPLPPSETDAGMLEEEVSACGGMLVDWSAVTA